MDGKRGSARRGDEALAALTDEILDPIVAADLDELERRLKLATASIKLRQALIETAAREAQLNAEEEVLDAAGEQRLRDDLYRRLVALADEIDAEGGAGAAGAGGAEPDPNGLAHMGPSGPETAAGAVDDVAVPGRTRSRKDKGGGGVVEPPRRRRRAAGTGGTDPA